VVFCFFSGPLYGKGKAEEEEPVFHNEQWVLAVTRFDAASLGPSRQIIGEVISRSLVESLNSVDRRFRISREYAYYEDYAWVKARSAAAKALLTKRGERDLLLFRGDPEWKYRNNLKAMDGDLKKLEENLQKIEAEMPLVVTEPVLQFTEDNNKGIFPAPPPKGGEYRFCQNQKADAFLAGTVSEYYGRIYVNLRLYTLYTRSFDYEDSIIFSSDNTIQAVGELADRLVAAVSGAGPAAITVHAEPENAVILIKESFAGRGEAPPREHPPGETTVEVFADNYEPLSIPVELFAGELAELYINLRPLSRAALTVTAPGREGSSVYHGALYIGQTPLSIDIFSNQFDYIWAETPQGETGKAAFKRDIAYSGDAGILELKTAVPLPPDSKPVETARRRFYGTYGKFWIALPLMIIMSGLSTNYTNAHAYNVQASQNNAEYNGAVLYDEAMNYHYISRAFWMVFGLTMTETVYRIYRYTQASGKGTASIVK
jgi:hypothetical protein